MIVAVVGASGGVGSATVKAALAAGLHVRAFARSREKLNAALGESVIDQLDAHVLGDISNPVALDALLSSNAEGNVPEVVLSCLGTPSGAKPCVRDGTLSLIQATQADGREFIAGEGAARHHLLHWRRRLSRAGTLDGLLFHQVRQAGVLGPRLRRPRPRGGGMLA